MTNSRRSRACGLPISTRRGERRSPRNSARRAGRLQPPSRAWCCKVITRRPRGALAGIGTAAAVPERIRAGAGRLVAAGPREGAPLDVAASWVRTPRESSPSACGSREDCRLFIAPGEPRLPRAGRGAQAYFHSIPYSSADALTHISADRLSSQIKRSWFSVPSPDDMCSM